MIIYINLIEFIWQYCLCYMFTLSIKVFPDSTHQPWADVNRNIGPTLESQCWDLSRGSILAQGHTIPYQQWPNEGPTTDITGGPMMYALKVLWRGKDLRKVIQKMKLLDSAAFTTDLWTCSQTSHGTYCISLKLNNKQ